MTAEPAEYRINHTTSYQYDDAISLGYNRAYLTPRETPWQHTRFTRVVVAPHPAVTSRRTDYFGNVQTLWTLQERHERLTITATSRVSLKPRPAADLAASPPWEAIRALVHADRSPEVLEALEQVFDSPMARSSPALRAYAGESFKPGRPVLAAARELTRRIFKDFAYKPDVTTVTTAPDEALALRAGVCQDFAHVAIAAMRGLGLPARYVSGYLRTLPPPGKPKLRGADASHAWFSVYGGKAAGWVDFDPTNDCVPGLDHITLAWGRDFGDVSPARGVVLGAGTQALSVAVDVTPVTRGRGHDAEPDAPGIE